jgi:hypothetical protein
MKRRKSLMIPAILLLCLFFISGCGDGVPEGTLSTTGATVALISDMPSGGLSAGQSCILTATLTDKSVTCDDKGVCTAAPQPLPGQVISFNFIVNESGAVLNVLNGGRTDAVGKAYAVYTAGSLQRGVNIQDAIQANIRDYSGVVTITRKGGGGSTAFSITVIATPNPLTTRTGSSVVKATVLNNAGEPVSGIQVTFAHAGTAGGHISDSTQITDNLGNAQTIYTSAATAVSSETIGASITIGGSTYTAMVIITTP